MNSLPEIYQQAYQYLNKLSSYRQSEDDWLVLEVKRKKSIFAEAITVVHVNGKIDPDTLGKLLDYSFTPEKMDVITDFFLRDILFRRGSTGKSWTGSEILSGRQLARRRAHESAMILDIHYI